MLVFPLPVALNTNPPPRGRASSIFVQQVFWYPYSPVASSIPGNRVFMGGLSYVALKRTFRVCSASFLVALNSPTGRLPFLNNWILPFHPGTLISLYPCRL